MCCSKAFKDYRETAKDMVLKTFEALVKASKNGSIFIVCDYSACSLELLGRAHEFEELKKVK